MTSINTIINSIAAARAARRAAQLNTIADHIRGDNRNPVALEISDARGRITYKIIDASLSAYDAPSMTDKIIRAEIARIESADGYDAWVVPINDAIAGSRAIRRAYR